MKKRLSFLALALLAVLSASAQMIAYTVQTKVEGPAGPPTVIDLQGNTGVDFSGLMIDAEGNLEFNDVIDAKAFPIGFDFGYNSQVMKYFLIATNGMIQLSPTETVSSVVHKNNVTVFTDSGNHDAFGLIMRNGMFGYDDTQISYWLEGDDVLCIQYKNIGIQTASYMSDRKDVAKATIEYRLYGKSGNIEIKVSGFKPYDDADVGNWNFMRIGILGDSGDFLQVQSYDGTVISANDNSISYNADSYPADGTVYTFVAPEPCETPATAPSALELSSTSTQVSGTFTAGSSDHYLVIASTGELTAGPTDQTKYHVGDEIGGGKVIAIVESNEFQSADDMAQAQDYTISVYGFNSLCSAGPLYNSTPATASIATKPGAPESISFSNIGKESVTVNVAATGNILVAMTDQQGTGRWGDYLNAGQFGEPSGDYTNGQEIDGGGKVIYTGAAGEAINLTDLEAGKAYFFRAWCSDGHGGYSSLYTDASVVTVADLPWQMVVDEKTGYDAVLPGWSFNDPSEWSSDPDAGYIFDRTSYADPETGAQVWVETPYIQLSGTANRIKTSLGGSSGGGWMSGDWTLGENEKIVFQLTKDDNEFVDIYTIDQNSGVTLSKTDFTPFTFAFDEYAGETVRLRIFVQRYTAGDFRLGKLVIEEKPEVAEPVNLTATEIVGGTVTLEWTPQGDESNWELEYKLADEEAWSEPVATTEPKVTLEGLVGATKYEARVRAVVGEKQSAWSEVAAFTTGFSVPFEFNLSGALDMEGWNTYSGVLGETTELTEGGDIMIRRMGWGSVSYRTLFNPYVSETNSWLVSPLLALGDDATTQYIAKLGLLLQFAGSDSNLSIKIVVAKDGENFSSADVIGTISNDELPATDEEPVEYSFPFSGYTGNVRLGYYIEGSGSDMTWLELTKVGLLIDTSAIQGISGAGTNDAVYSLQGVKLNKAQRGVNIINGKKVLVK